MKLGDVVRLKSGGPWMTVIGSYQHDGEMISCCWFTDAEPSVVRSFPIEALVSRPKGEDAYQSAVTEFAKKFGGTINKSPTIPNLQDRELRIALIAEEFDEFQHASDDCDIVGVADGLGDLLYVVFYAAIAWGIDMWPVFEEIQRSNMTKVWPDGSVKKREDGKVMKPPDYSKPDLAKVLGLENAFTAEAS